MSRVSKKIITETILQEDAESFFAIYADADAKEKKILAEMDVKITKIREGYQDKLTELTKVKADNFEKLQYFATTNPDIFAKKKSLEMTHGILGFRTGTPKLKTLKGYTWGAVLQLIKEYLPAYVRTSEDVAKDRLLADREDESVKANMRKVGLDVAQDETFYVEPKKELIV